MFRKKVRMLLLSAALAGTMALPVSAAETTAPSETTDISVEDPTLNTDDEATSTEENVGAASDEENYSDEMNPSDETITSDDLTITGEEGEGETGLPDEEQLVNVQEDMLGSISITLTEGKEGTSLNGVTFHCTKVADITGGEYVLTEAFSDVDIDLNNLKNADEAAEAAKKLVEVEAEDGASAKTDADGKLVFSELDAGVYLVSADDTETYDIVTPALVAIPSWNEEAKEMAYDLDVEPKHTEREDEEEEPGAPQTNVFSPVYLYFGGAAALAAITVTGNIIYKRRKK